MNYAAADEADRITAFYGPNNVFRVNQNIPPS
jgi:hypothetical protein